MMVDPPGNGRDLRLYLLTTTAESLFRKWGFRRAPRNTVPEGIRATVEFSSLCTATAAPSPVGGHAFLIGSVSRSLESIGSDSEVMFDDT